MALESKGFNVSAVATVPEALQLISSQPFDVLIADLNVGHTGDGFTVVSAMRRTQPNAATFILTGYPAFEIALEAIRQQVDDYLIKPTEVDTLGEKIRSTLAKHRAPGSRRSDWRTFFSKTGIPSLQNDLRKLRKIPILLPLRCQTPTVPTTCTTPRRVAESRAWWRADD